jgi:hypothetical protein
MVAMHALRRRLAAAERAIENSRPLTGAEAQEAALAAWHDGTITYEAFRRFWPREYLVQDVTEMMGMAYFNIAVVKHGLRPSRDDVSAWWYPPDCELPPRLVDALDGLFDEAHRPFAEWRRREGRFTDLEGTIARRQTTLRWALLMGDRRALPARRRIWVVDGERWVPSPRVIAAAKAPAWPLTPARADKLLESRTSYSHLFRDAVAKGLIEGIPAGTPDDGPATINLFSFVRACEEHGWLEGPGNPWWSDQVKSGHDPTRK